MAEAISRRPLTAEACVQSQIRVSFVVDRVTVGQGFIWV
jgi:hypothetical protein